jgi:hypothetical protein
MIMTTMLKCVLYNFTIKQTAWWKTFELFQKIGGAIQTGELPLENAKICDWAEVWSYKVADNGNWTNLTLHCRSKSSRMLCHIDG